jgi:hypothetical protein
LKEVREASERNVINKEGRYKKQFRDARSN